MKLPVYIRQSWQIILKDRHYSLTYIIGVTLSMAVVTAILIVFVMIGGNVYPENHRGRTMVLSDVYYEMADGSDFSTTVPDELVRLVMEADPEGIEAMSATSPAFTTRKQPVTAGDAPVVHADVLYVDEGFWKVFGFDFVSGSPFGAGRDSGPEAVVSSTMARKYFGTETDAVGQIMNVGGRPVTVCGVVRDVSLMARNTDADIWLPRDFEKAGSGTLASWAGLPEGGNHIFFLAGSRRDFDDIRNAVETAVARYNASLPADCGYRISEATQALPCRAAAFVWSPALVLSMAVGIVVMILLIPAVNLCGMVSSSLQERLAEFGVRKSYGAPVRTVFLQIFAENMVMTLVGSVVGFVLSLGLLRLLSGWFESGVTSVYDIGTGTQDVDLVFPVEPFFNPVLYLLVFAAVVLLTLFSSVQPVLKTIRRGPVDLLKDNIRMRKRGVRSLWLVVEGILVFVIAWPLLDPMLLNAVRTHAVPTGWEPERVVYVNPTPLSGTDEEVLAGFDRIGQTLAGLDGVEAVTPSTVFSPGTNSGTAALVYTDTAHAVTATCFIKEPGTDFMKVFGFDMVDPLEGVDPLDEGPGTVIISEDVAEALFPGKEAVGQILYIKSGTPDGTPRIVAGVISRQKVRMKSDNPRPVVIVNMAAFPAEYCRSGMCCWTMRLSGDADMTGLLETLNSGKTDGVALAYPVTKVMDSYVDTDLQRILLCYLLVNLVLGALSHYFLRTRWRMDEMGVRKAMGASPGRILLEEAAYSLKVSALTCAVGIFAIFNYIVFSGREVTFVGQINMPRLPETTLAPWPLLGSDFLSALAVTLVVGAVIFLTNILSALLSVWQASRIRPSEALREE